MQVGGMASLLGMSASKASYERFSSFVLHAGPSSRRSFASSGIAHASPVGHYEALSLPRNATRQQVKARFYELSKKYHPDAPGGNTSKFHEINDAYATLGNDSKRRQYDQSMSQSSTAAHTFGGGGIHRPHRTGPHPAWGRAPPRRQHAPGSSSQSQAYHNPFSRRAPPNYDPFSPQSGRTSSASGYARTSPDPFGRTSSAGARRRGGGLSDGGDGDPEIRSEGALWRFVVVVGLLVAVVSFGGGLTASADIGDPEDLEDGESEDDSGNREKRARR